MVYGPSMRTAITIPAILALAMATGFARDPSGQDKKEDKKYFASFLGKAPPKLTIGEKDWINAKAPITLEGCKGKVVWLQFSYSH